MLLSVRSFRISENLHRTWQRNPEVRNMKSEKQKQKKDFMQNIDHASSIKRAAIHGHRFFSDSTPPTMKGTTFSGTCGKNEPSNPFSRNEPQICLTLWKWWMLFKKKDIYITWFWGPLTPHVRLLCVLLWAAPWRISLLCKDRAWQVDFFYCF